MNVTKRIILNDVKRKFREVEREVTAKRARTDKISLRITPTYEFDVVSEYAGLLHEAIPDILKKWRGKIDHEFLDRLTQKIRSIGREIKEGIYEVVSTDGSLDEIWSLYDQGIKDLEDFFSVTQ